MKEAISALVERSSRETEFSWSFNSCKAPMK